MLGRACIDLVWSITEPHDARLAAGARAAVTGSIRVEQQHGLAGPVQCIRSPNSKHSRADYRQVVAHAVIVQDNGDHGGEPAQHSPLHHFTPTDYRGCSPSMLNSLLTLNDPGTPRARM